MNQSLSDVMKEAYALAPSSKTIIHTLEIRQTGVQDTVYIAQSRREVVAYDENLIERTFEPIGFQFSLPPSTEDGIQTLNLAIDNVSRRLSDYIETALTQEVPVEVIYRPYDSTNLSGPQMNPPLVLYVKEINITLLQVNCTCTFMDLVNRPFPSELYTRDRFPTLA